MLLHFMDAAGPELRTQSAGVSLLQLQSLLEGAVRGSSAAADPEAARLAVAWDHRSILTMLIASQQALTAAAGAEGAAKTPFSKVGRCCLLGREVLLFVGEKGWRVQRRERAPLQTSSPPQPLRWPWRLQQRWRRLTSPSAAPAFGGTRADVCSFGAHRPSPRPLPCSSSPPRPPP